MSLTVDIERYRRRREKQLNTLAFRMAEQVKRTRRPVTLEPMPPNERRIIHLTLQQETDLATESVGDGRERRLQVRLK